MDSKQIVAWLVVPIWIVLSAAGLYLISGLTTSAFDPNGTLYERINRPDFDQEFALHLTKSLNKPLNNLVLHIASGEQCLCQVSSSRHINTVKTLAQEQGKLNIDLQVNTDRYLQSVITSTPAIAVFDQEGRLSYLGPYATGMGCFTGNGQVEPYLNYRADVGGAVVPVDAAGCYCANDKARAV